MSGSRQLLTVLLAEDDDDGRCLLGEAWAKSRAADELRFVGDGEELTEYLKHTGRYRDQASAPRPALILLDLNMPKNDGREALREIKADPKLRQIPVIVLTTSKDDNDISRSYDLGANSYVAKPAS